MRIGSAISQIVNFTYLATLVILGYQMLLATQTRTNERCPGQSATGWRTELISTGMIRGPHPLSNAGSRQRIAPAEPAGNVHRNGPTTSSFFFSSFGYRPIHSLPHSPTSQPRHTGRESIAKSVWVTAIPPQPVFMNIGVGNHWLTQLSSSTN